MHTHTHTHAHSRACTRTCAHSHAHTRTRACSHTQVHARAHVHTHTLRAPQVSRARRPLCRPAVRSCQPRCPSRPPPWLDPKPRAADPHGCSGHRPPRPGPGTPPCRGRRCSALFTGHGSRLGTGCPHSPLRGLFPMGAFGTSSPTSAGGFSREDCRLSLLSPSGEGSRRVPMLAPGADAGSEWSAEETRAGAGPRAPPFTPGLTPPGGPRDGDLVPVVSWVDIRDGLVTSAVHSR